MAVTAAVVCAAATALGAPEAGDKLAYIDPGSGSFILQALVAALAGVAVAVHAYWTRIKRMLGIGASKRDEDAAAAKPNDD